MKYTLLLVLLAQTSLSFASFEYQVVPLQDSDKDHIIAWFDSDREIYNRLSLSYYSHTKHYVNTASNNYKYLVAKRLQDACIHGFVKYSFFRGTGIIEGLAVHQDVRGKGIGQALLSTVFKKHPKINQWGLFVDPENQPAISLYTKNGFLPQVYFGDDTMNYMETSRYKE